MQERGRRGLGWLCSSWISEDRALDELVPWLGASVRGRDLLQDPSRF